MQNNISAAKAPPILELCKATGYNPNVLSQISIDRTTVSYKGNYGIAATYTNRTLAAMKNQFFSLNIDESKASNNHKFLSILVSYYCTEQNRIIMRHLASISLKEVDSKALYWELVKLFKKHDI